MKKLYSFINLIRFREKLFLLFIFFATFLVSIVETISLGSIAGYVMVLSDPNFILDKLPDGSTKIFFYELDTRKFIIYSTIILIGIFIIKNIFLLLFNFFNMWVEKNILVDLSSRLLIAYLQKPYLFHINNNPNILINSIISETNRATAYIFSFINLLREFIILVILLSTTILISYKLTILIGISLGLSSVIFLVIVKNLLKKLGIKSKEFSELRLKDLTETFGVIKILKLQNLKNFFLDKFKINQINKIKTENMLRFVTLIPRSFLEIFGIITIAITTFFFIYSGYEINSIIPTLTLLGVILVRSIPAFGVINVNISVLEYHNESMKNILREFNLYEDKTNKDEIIQKEKNFKIEKISSENLSFQYPDTKSSTLKNISLDIKKGEFIGIMGNSGSGKSTIIDIILGLLSPTSGQIKINDDSKISLVDNLQRKIGYVPQDIYLIDDTIEKNIALGVKQKNINKEKIEMLITALNLNKIIFQSKDGIQTIIGNRGIKISGGQRQRIGIARALYNNPEILILDEATNALDMDTEKNILKKLYDTRHDKITILINHRIKMLNICDNIYVLENGEIVEQGKLKDLSKVKFHN